MDKKLVVILVIIICSLIGITFLVSSMLPKEALNEPTQQENTFDVNLELANIQNIIEGVKIDEGKYNDLYNNQEFLDKINELKTLGASSIVSNIDPQNEKYCISFIFNGSNLCIDNIYIGGVDNSGCIRGNTSCFNNVEQAEAIEIIMPEQVEEEIISTEEDPVEVIEVEQIEEIKVIEGLSLEEEVIVGETSISKYKNNNGQEIIFINEKEHGPYSESYITYNDSGWGVLCNYNDKWYVNLNGKATGPYTQKPVVEFYGEDLGFSYIKNDEYYVNLNGKTYGPYEDLLEFNLDNN